MSFEVIYTLAQKGISTITGSMTADVLRERIALLSEQLEILRTTHEQTEEKLAHAEEKCQALQKEISKYRITNQFIQSNGAAFKKDTAGNYIDSVYCPNCFIVTGSFDCFPFSCDKCGWIASFTHDDLPQILSRLPK